MANNPCMGDDLKDLDIIVDTLIEIYFKLVAVWGRAMPFV